jgi:hypothetical protein
LYVLFASKLYNLIKITIMKKLLVLIGLSLSVLSCKAQYDRGYDNDYGNNYDDNITERYFYEDNFDWRWDARVRITDGINSGSITNGEARRLYDRLERIERKEYAYQADGNFSAYEQEDIWDDVVYLNRKIGIELTDNDRRYYGYNGLAFRALYPGIVEVMIFIDLIDVVLVT